MCDWELQCCIRKGPPKIPILSRIKPIPRIDAYFYNILSDIVLKSTPRPSESSLSCRFSSPTFFHSDYMTSPSQYSRPNHYILGNGTKYEFPHCEAFFMPHSHPLGPKYSLQYPVFNTLSLLSSLLSWIFPKVWVSYYSKISSHLYSPISCFLVCFPHFLGQNDRKLLKK